MLKKYLWAMFAACILTACSNDDMPEPIPNDNSITILSYLIADNNLNDDLLGNIGTMYDGLAKIKEPATLLIYWDGETSINGNANHLLLRYVTDGKGNINGKPALDLSSTLDEVLEIADIVKEYPSQISTDKQTMELVMRDMLAQAPTNKYGLIFGSHGSSWLNTIYTSRSFGQDGSKTDNTILLSEITDVLNTLGKTFEFILFDACYMGTIEVCHEFRNISNYLIVSAMEVPAYGFPYESILKDLHQGTINHYQQACKTFIDFYTHEERAWGTVALIDCKEIETLIAHIKSEITDHKDILANYEPYNLQDYGKKPGPYIAYDMAQFIQEINDNQLPDSFQNQLEKTVLYKGCVEKAIPSSHSIDVTNYCGLGIYIPVVHRPSWNEYFQTIDWYTASGWNEVNFEWDFYKENSANILP